MRKPNEGGDPICFYYLRYYRLFVIVLAASVLVLPAPRMLADDPDNCLFCHQYRGLSYFDYTNDTSHVFFVQPEYVHQRLGPHAVVACTDCHERAEVTVVPHRPVTKVDCAKNCHLGRPGALEQRFNHRNVAEMLQQGIHTREVLTKIGEIKARLLSPGQSLCLYCHDEPIFRDPTGSIPLLKELGSRTFERCDVCHLRQSPAETAYYLRHMAARLQPARPTLEMAQVCAVCHSDPAVCIQFKMQDAVSSYVRSFHGKAALLGDAKTANCLSCHIAPGANVHLMLKPDHPASAVGPVQVANTCRNMACHPGADATLGAASVHLDLPAIRGHFEFWMALAFIVLTVATFGPSMIICVLELVPQVLGWKSHHSHRMDQLTRAVLSHPEGRKRLIRFTLAQRIQHWVLAVLFALLVITGFPLKFADQRWSQVVIDQFGGLNTARLMHHWGGFLLVIGLAVHVIYILATMVQKARRAHRAGHRLGPIQSLLALPLWIGPRDILDFVHLLAHLLKLRKDRPSFGRFSIKEKFEYIGVFWGTLLLGATGFLLWGAEISSHFVSGRFLNFALIGHTYEAFLAIIHVGILHIVNVMLSPNVFPLSPATLTGETPVAELSEGHSDQVLQVAQELGLTPPENIAHE
jgi:cytochrome b subunit of formate dehydrogenase